jgi:hypothetical protein
VKAAVSSFELSQNGANVGPDIRSRAAKKPRGSAKRFFPGRSGNPDGRPKRTAEVLDLILACKAKTPEALAIIADLMAKGDNRIRLAAALAIIERGYGKPTQPTTHAGGTGGSVQVEAIRTDWEALRASMALPASMRERGTPGT